MSEDDLLKSQLINYLKSNEIPSSDLKKLLESTTEIENRKKVIPKSERKYKLLVKLLNSILTELNKPIIEDVLKFKNINRDDILKLDTNKIVNDHINEIVIEYGKSCINYSNRNKVNLYILSLIRRMCKTCGYKLDAVYKTINKKVGDYYKLGGKEVRYRIIIKKAE